MSVGIIKVVRSYYDIKMDVIVSKAYIMDKYSEYTGFNKLIDKIDKNVKCVFVMLLGNKLCFSETRSELFNMIYDDPKYIKKDL